MNMLDEYLVFILMYNIMLHKTIKRERERERMRMRMCAPNVPN